MTENDSRAGHFHQRTPRRVVKTWNSKEDVGLGYGAIRAHDISNKPSEPLTTRSGVGYEENVVREPRDCSSRNIPAQSVINHESQSTQHKLSAYLRCINLNSTCSASTISLCSSGAMVCPFCTR